MKPWDPDYSTPWLATTVHSTATEEELQAVPIATFISILEYARDHHEH
jgi:hypothetical protein